MYPSYSASQSISAADSRFDKPGISSPSPAFGPASSRQDLWDQMCVVALLAHLHKILSLFSSSATHTPHSQVAFHGLEG